MINECDRDNLCLGDANLCAMKWNNDDYHQREFADMVQNHLIETASTHIVKEYNISDIVRGNKISRSLIDHCYTNVPDKVSTPEVSAIGTSDHLAVFIIKRTKATISRPKIVQKRSYVNFDVEMFLNDINNSDINL